MAPDLGAGGTGTACSPPRMGNQTCPEFDAPSADCASAVCLVEPSLSFCTSPCTSDIDCQMANTAQCSVGFVCGVVTNAGPFAGRKYCICKLDYPNPPSCP